MESEDELAAVLGHETGHVTARHAAQQYTRQMFAQLAMVGASVYLESHDVKNRELYMLGGMFGTQLALARYSRDQERQSDDLGFDYMIEAGYNPRGMVDLMQILESGHQRQPNLLETWFSSHPMTSERIDTTRAHLKNVPPNVLNRPIKSTAFSRPTSKVRSQREAYDRLAEAQSLLSQEKSGGARKLLQQSVDEWRNDGLLRGYLAGALWVNDQPGPAMSAAAEAMRDAPGIFAVQSIGGQIFVSQKKWQTALGALNRADQIMPGVPPIRFQRGQCLEALGKRVEAIQAYRWVAQAVPESELGAEAAARANRLGSQMN
jgi:predicted Zn-dependent protease